MFENLTFVVMSRLLMKPLVIQFCPLKILFDSFYSVNTQNSQEFKRNCKGQKSITKGDFLEINVARFTRNNAECEISSELAK